MRKWTSEEDSYLKESAHKFTYSQLCEKFKVSYRQIARRCQKLGVSAKTMNTSRQLTEKEVRICLEKPICEAAELVGVHPLYVKRIKEAQNRTWTSEDDAILIKRMNNNPIDKTAELFKASEDGIKERFAQVLQEEKVKTGIDEIFSNFPDLLPGQIQMVKSIYSYSPKSAIEYCKNIHNFRTKILDKIK